MRLGYIYMLWKVLGTASSPNSRTKAQVMKLIACLRIHLFMMDHVYEILLLATLNAAPSLGLTVSAPPAAVLGLDRASTQSTSPSIASLGSGTVQSALSTSVPFAYGFSSPSTPSTDTIWDLLESLDDMGSEDLAWTTDTTNGTSLLTQNSSSLNRRDLVSSVDQVRSQRALNVFFNSTDHGAYNLTIPGCLAADAILGDVELPNGTFVTNATFATLITSMQLPSAALYNYTLTMATMMSERINATLNKIICDGGAGATRRLLMPNGQGPGWRDGWRDPDNSEGFVTAFIVGLLGTTGIAWAGTRIAIAHHWPTQNVSIDTEVAILAATTAMEFTFITMLWRLQSVPKRWVGRWEAMVLNAFIWIGGKLLSGLEYINQNTCCDTETAQAGLSNFMRRASQSAQVLRFGYQRNANAMSSQNLMGAGLTNVDIAPVTQLVAERAIELMERGQIEGGTQPGATCPGAT